MHKKIIISLLVASILLDAKELNNEKFQLVAENLDKVENITTANGNVVVFSPTYYLSADKVKYYEESDTFELFGNVLIIKDNTVQTQSDYAYVDLKNDIFNQNPLFFNDAKSTIWINSKTSVREKNVIDLNTSIISSCDCIDPIWSIKATSADLDTEDKWLNAYNARLYIKDVPVFYSPYFGFPTDKTRRSGLLLPTLGYSSSEGFHYSQPIYYAPADNYDLEFVPQIRTNRGKGMYTYYRYADSPNSMLNVKTGIFQEDDDYREKKLLNDKEHYGIDLDYSRTNMLSNAKSDDGLYTSLKYLNDVEYVTLENDDSKNTTDKKVESKINYFYNTNDYYAGTYARYYIDTSKDSNKTTLQELPQLHLHGYNKEIFTDRLIYNIDSKFMNYTRPEGLTANVYEINLPVSYSKSFMDDYFYITLESKTIVSKYDYDNFSTIKYEDGNLIQNRNSVQVGTDLIKSYTDNIHTMNINAEFVVPKNLKDEGDLGNVTIKKINNPLTQEDILNNTKFDELKAFPILNEDKNIKLSLNQSLYDKEDLQQYINHKMSQSILYDEFDNPKLEDYENFVKLNYGIGSVSGKVVYNMEDQLIVEESLNNVINIERTSFGAGYYMSKATTNPTNLREDLESYRFNVAYKISKDYSTRYYENYNLEEKIRSKQGIGFNINDGCWNLDLRYERDIKPISSSYVNGVDQRVILATLMLKPIGGIKQKYKIDENNH